MNDTTKTDAAGADKTLQDLVDLGQQRGYATPAWARRVMEARANTSPLTCLSCGAQGHKDAPLDCGH